MPLLGVCPYWGIYGICIFACFFFSIGELLDGKGAAKRGRFQGKANKLSKRPHAEKLILETLGISPIQNSES